MLRQNLLELQSGYSMLDCPAQIQTSPISTSESVMLLSAPWTVIEYGPPGGSAGNSRHQFPFLSARVTDRDFPEMDPESFSPGAADPAIRIGIPVCRTM